VEYSGVMRALLSSDHPDRTIVLTAALVLAGAVGGGLAIDPALYWLVLCMGAGAGALLLVWRFPTGFSVVWLLVTAASLEMTLYDLAGQTMFTASIAAVKGMGLLLAAVLALRFGVRFDLTNPALVYVFMLVMGLAHGLYPNLTAADSVRSCIGSAAPFAFAFVRLPRNWAEAMIAATKWCPVVVVLAAVPLQVAGLRPLFVESGGWRLGGLGHPAFLANVCLPAIYASLIELFGRGGARNLLLFLMNGLILLLTGARAPLAYAAAVSAISLLAVPAPMFPASTRRLLLLAAGLALPVAIGLAATFADIRIFNVTLNETANLSGRDLLWPAFRQAAEQSPWFGWGLGAGNFVIPPDSTIAKTLQTWAAHNEYLRMQVEGGEIGRALLFLSFAAWVTVHTRPLPASDRMVMRLAFIAYACHAVTDNVLISTPACVLFAFAAAVFARGNFTRGNSPRGDKELPEITLPDSTRRA
jgi:O-antigen ligase